MKNRHRKSRASYKSDRLLVKLVLLSQLLEVLGKLLELVQKITK